MIVRLCPICIRYLLMYNPIIHYMSISELFYRCNCRIGSKDFLRYVGLKIRSRNCYCSNSIISSFNLWYSKEKACWVPCAKKYIFSGRNQDCKSGNKDDLHHNWKKMHCWKVTFYNYHAISTYDLWTFFVERLAGRSENEYKSQMSP